MRFRPLVAVLFPFGWLVWKRAGRHHEVKTGECLGLETVRIATSRRTILAVAATVEQIRSETRI
jgi:hypothetical protein